MFTLTLLQFLFWASLAMVTFTFLGYPLWLKCLARFRPRALTAASAAFAPPVSVVLCVHNEAARIKARLQNLLNSAWPADKIEIVIVSDGSTDNGAEIARGLGDARVRVIEQPERRGKPAGLNAGIAAAKGELVVLTDARQEFAPDTIARLVAHFTDASVGAVSGALTVAGSGAGVAGGVDAYWRLEKSLREAEARWDSCIGCTGAVYAIRRELYQPIPDDTLIDDVVIPMQIALGGKRVLFDPEARAFDPQTLEPERERIRKRRTLAGNFQMLFRYPGWLLPWRNRLWWQLLCHKYLRLAAPVFLLALFAANAALTAGALYRALFWGQCAFYACALAGMAVRSIRFPLVSLPAGFVFLNLMTMAGLWYYLRGSRERGWEMAKT